MSLSIHLLGTPRIIRDGTSAVLRGRKAWALLAFLITRRGEVGREELAGLLFSDADDPLGALRWNLTELRRALGPDAVPKGSSPRLELPRDTIIDIDLLTSSTWSDATDMPDLGLEFLEGVHLSGSPAFEAWLLNQRRHVRAASHSLLREATLELLGARRATEAADLAARLVAMDPLDEDHQRLSIRAYAAAGDKDAATEQARRGTELFRKELGVTPVPSFEDEVADVEILSDDAGRGAIEPSIAAQIEAGMGAVKAGALEAGLLHLRRAAGLARDRGDAVSEMEAFFGIGSALAHAGQRRHAEAATTLHTAAGIAKRLGDDETRAGCYRELAWIELMGARYERSQVWIDKALTICHDDERARLLTVRGMGLTEMSRYAAAMDSLETALDLARSSGDLDETARAATILARAHLLRGELDHAETQCRRSLDVARSRGWTWFIPWPECYLAEVLLARGEREEARGIAEHAATLARELGDPSFEAKAARVAGIIAAAEGGADRAMSLLQTSIAILDRSPDSTWLEAYVLDSLCRVSADAGFDQAPWLDRLEVLAGRSGMRELLVKAYLHRSRTDPGALESAWLLAVDVDNPVLHREISERAPTAFLSTA